MKIKIRRSLVLLLVLCMMTAMISMIHADQAAVAEEVQERTLVVLGDSIATGYLVENPEDTYGAIMARTMGLTEVNLAVNGDDSTDLLAVLASEEAVKAIQSTEYIAVSIGGNNLLKLLAQNVQSMDSFNTMLASFTPEMVAQLSAGITTFQAEFPQIIETIKSINPNAVILVQTVYNPYMFIETEGLFNFAELSDSLIVMLNEVITTYLAENPGTFALSDVYAAFEATAEPTYLNADLASANYDPHPSREGHALIAQTNLAALEATPMPITETPSSETTTIREALSIISEALTAKLEALSTIDFDSAITSESATAIIAKFTEILG